MLPKVFLKQESLGLSMEQEHLGARQMMTILFTSTKKISLHALLNSDTDIEGIYTCLAKNVFRNDGIEYESFI